MLLGDALDELDLICVGPDLDEHRAFDRQPRPRRCEVLPQEIVRKVRGRQYALGSDVPEAPEVVVGVDDLGRDRPRL